MRQHRRDGRALVPHRMDELVATLPDDALAHLVIATARQLRRRLARSHGRSGKGCASTLERSAQQLIVELGGQGENDDDW